MGFERGGKEILSTRVAIVDVDLDMDQSPVQQVVEDLPEQ